MAGVAWVSRRLLSEKRLLYSAGNPTYVKTGKVATRLYLCLKNKPVIVSAIYSFQCPSESSPLCLQVHPSIGSSALPQRDW